MLVSVGTDEASDSWGFVGVVKVGEVEAFRTLEAFPSRAEALRATQKLMGDVLGELLAGREWRTVRDSTGQPPTRQDFNISAFRSSRGRAAGRGGLPDPG
ncbi:MAG TPA: hypothetical protein VFU36_04070 [Jatrophihabitans sp.]|nr:hypothetical protein [Jatrophihabitans sp.]